MITKIYEGKRIYDNIMELFAIIKNCDNIKEVEVDYIGGGHGKYNLDQTDPNWDFEVKI